MYDDLFWDILSRALSAKTGKLRVKILEQQLRGLSDEEMEGVFRLWHQCHKRAYISPLWAAAFLLQNASCSDDDFFDFRSGLIMLGKDIFEKALDDPDSLATLGKREMKALLCDEKEFYTYTFSDIYEEKFGGEKLAEDLTNLSKYSDDFPQGKEYDEDDVSSFETDFIRLTALFRKKDEKAMAAYRSLDFNKIDPEGVFPDWLRNGQ